MVNCNPETVSTDYDTSDRLFFEPLTDEDVLNVVRRAAATPGELRGRDRGARRPDAAEARARARAAGIPVLGTSPTSIDLAEDRDRSNALCDRLGIPQPAGGTATDRRRRARDRATRIGYPGARAAVVRARRPRHGDRLRRRRACAAAMAELAGRGSLGREGGLSAERPALDRPLPRGRDRGRRRRAPRRAPARCSSAG